MTISNSDRTSLLLQRNLVADVEYVPLQLCVGSLCLLTASYDSQTCMRTNTTTLSRTAGPVLPYLFLQGSGRMAVVPLQSEKGSSSSGGPNQEEKFMSISPI